MILNESEFSYIFSNLGLVQGRCAEHILDIGLFLHSSVPHRRAAKLRPQVHNTHRLALVRLRSNGRQRAVPGARGRRLSQGLVPRRRPVGPQDTSSGRVVAQTTARRHANYSNHTHSKGRARAQADVHGACVQDERTSRCALHNRT